MWWGVCNGTVSVRPSVCLSHRHTAAAACGGLSRGDINRLLQCFDAVGWAAGRASGLTGGVLAWLSVWSEVQTCIQSS